MALVVAPWRLVALSSSLLSCWSEVRILPGASHERPPRRRRYRRAHDARRGAQRAGLRRHRSRAWRRSVGQPAARLLPDRHFRLADARSRWAGALSPPARARDRPLFLLSLNYGDGREKTVPRGYGSGRRRFHHEADRMDELRARLKAAERILGLRQHVQQLEGLLPICAYCKRIRDDSEKWESIERYVEERSEAQFSHGYCPDCYEKYVRPQIEKR